ncbi:unnamed protein product, partial [Mesorhabditis belari]|uniref:BZIP domain-containing protein n=1 Tax=Mesorhabditis belari TaxID=2138241 RepID=A0AAF3FDI7_9BILA
MCSPGEDRKRMNEIEREKQIEETVEMEMTEIDSGHDSASESQPSPSAFRSTSSSFPLLDPLLMQQQIVALLSAQLGSLPSVFPQSSILGSLNESSTLLNALQAFPSINEVEFMQKIGDPSSDETISSTSDPPQSILDSSDARSVITPSKKQTLDYAERRRRNNDSARRSREIRRQREVENRHKSETLEKENDDLKQEILRLRAELARLTIAVLQQQQQQQKQKTEKSS